MNILKINPLTAGFESAKRVFGMHLDVEARVEERDVSKTELESTLAYLALKVAEIECKEDLDSANDVSAVVEDLAS